MLRIAKWILLVLFVLCFSYSAHAQAWSGILLPTSGGGACNPGIINSGPQKCAIDWSGAGVQGGIPNRTTLCSSLTPSATLAQINSALSSCPSGQVVFLSAGTYQIPGTIQVPSNVTLRGAGTLKTILNTTGSGTVIQMGGGGPNYNSPANTSISSGATAGSTSIVVASASGISTGTLLAVSELNDLVYIQLTTPAQGTCTFCDGTADGGVRVRGQVVRVTNVAGTTLTIDPPLYTNYGSASGTGPALVYPYAQSVHDAGVENLQVFANNTGYGQVYGMTACYNCWVKGVYDNYVDGDTASVFWSLHVEFRDSYFSNAYLHGPGTYDDDINFGFKTSASKIENNIFERLHVGVFVRWGAAGNVVGYNYEIGNFDASATQVILSGYLDHGTHPQFTLWEGNSGDNITKDSFWGSSSHTTVFRNHFRGSDTLAQPLTTGRHIVNWGSTSITTQQLMAEQFAWPHTNINNIGNVLGGADVLTVATAGKYNGGTAPFTSTIVPSANRQYSNFFSATSVGYDTGSDSSGSGVNNISGGPSNTAGYWVGKATGTIFQHGNFDVASNLVIWNGSITHTLPASFYLSSQPSWWGSMPFPAIGPDVTGGSVDPTVLLGHVYMIPAEFCYNSTARDSNGMKLFDPSVCYAGVVSQPPVAPILHQVVVF